MFKNKYINISTDNIESNIFDLKKKNLNTEKLWSS